ncbi:hypothetical protein GCM10020367_21150 [Streptomyces sannanensis]|uniref:Uncharacterized protein n=1 Tax=Streptomyces sannanensis TaxID=285536 RepID=A0ABN1KBR5_9ACTN
MVNPSHETELRLVFYRCRLGRSELDRIFNQAPDGIPAASVSVSTQRESTRYSAGALADLIDSIRNANAPGNLDIWDNVTLEAADPAGDRKVTVAIDTERVEVQVSGRDATWAHGQAARLELLLEGAGGQKQGKMVLRSRKYWAQLIAAMASFTGAMLLGSYIGSPETFLADQTREKTLASLGSIAGMLAWLLVATLTVAIIRRANRALLLPTAEVPQGSWWHRASHADRIALGSLIVATLALVVAAVTLGKELTGDTGEPPAKKTTAAVVDDAAVVAWLV